MSKTLHNFFQRLMDMLCFVNCLGGASGTVLFEEDGDKDVVVGHPEMAQENEGGDQPGEGERVVDNGVDLGINGEGQERIAVEDGGPEEEEDRGGETDGGDASVDAVVHMEEDDKGNGIVEKGGNRMIADEGQGKDEEEGGEGNSEKEGTAVKHEMCLAAFDEEKGSGDVLEGAPSLISRGAEDADRCSGGDVHG